MTPRVSFNGKRDPKRDNNLLQASHDPSSPLDWMTPVSMDIQKQRQQVSIFVLILYTFTLDISKAAWCSTHELQGHIFPKPVNKENKVDLKGTTLCTRAANTPTSRHQGQVDTQFSFI